MPLPAVLRIDFFVFLIIGDSLVLQHPSAPLVFATPLDKRRALSQILDLQATDLCRTPQGFATGSVSSVMFSGLAAIERGQIR